MLLFVFKKIMTLMLLPSIGLLVRVLEAPFDVLAMEIVSPVHFFTGTNSIARV